MVTGPCYLASTPGHLYSQFTLTQFIPVSDSWASSSLCLGWGRVPQQTHLPSSSLNISLKFKLVRPYILITALKMQSSFMYYKMHYVFCQENLKVSS